MAKRKAKAPTRKAQTKSRHSSRKSSAGRRRASRPVRKASSRTSARPKARAARKAAPRKAAAKARKPALKSRKPAPSRTVSVRPKPAALSRERRRLRDEDAIPGAPSILNYERKASSAESGHQMYHQRAKEHTEGGAALTTGDVDADWNDAYSSGEETPGGDMPTPDQDVVEEIGRALGVEYEDAEELKGAEKIEERDRHRWEYDPASSDDYRDRTRREED